MDFIIDTFLHIDQHLISLVQEYHGWTYAILFVIIFCETGLVVLPFLPGDSLLFVSGAVASLPGMPLEISLLMMVIFIAAVLGDSCNYLIGHYFGKKTVLQTRLKDLQAKSFGENPSFLPEIWRKNHNHCPFCPHCPHFCTVCRRNGTHELLLVYDLQPCRGSCLGLTFLHDRLFLWKHPFCAAKPQNTFDGHRTGFTLPCPH